MDAARRSVPAAKKVCPAGVPVLKRKCATRLKRARKDELRVSLKFESRSESSPISEIEGGQGRDRTGDTRIFSPLLYQLSYLAPCVKMVGAQGFEPWTQ